MKVVSIVQCAGGYQATAEFQVPVNMYPHYRILRVCVRGSSIEDAVQKVTEKAKKKEIT